MNPAALGQTIQVVDKSGKVVNTVSISLGSKLAWLICFIVEQASYQRLERSQICISRAKSGDCRRETGHC